MSGKNVKVTSKGREHFKSKEEAVKTSHQGTRTFYIKSKRGLWGLNQKKYPLLNKNQIVQKEILINLKMMTKYVETPFNVNNDKSNILLNLSSELICLTTKQSSNCFQFFICFIF